MENPWNDTDREKSKYAEKNMSQCHFFHHKSHMDKPGPPLSLFAESINRLLQGEDTYTL
jgi:hypothetical protein